jgi:hypothetical protein
VISVFSKLLHLASYISRHNAMAYDMAQESMEYQHDIHGLDVLLCGEDGLIGQQGLNHHANPGEWQ